MQNLRNEIDLADIDYIIINHAEEDHAGALTELMTQIPDTLSTAPPTRLTQLPVIITIRSGILTS